MLNKKTVVKTTKQPSKEECLQFLNLTDMDLAMLRAIKTRGLQDWVLDKAKLFQEPEEKEPIQEQVSGSYRSYSSLAYNYFRNKFKEEGPGWKTMPESDNLTQIQSELDSIKESKLDSEKILLLSGISARLYILYRSLVVKTEEDV